MNITNYHILKSILLLFTVFFLLTTTVNAQQISLSLGPNLTKIAIKPGNEVIQKYTVVNNGDPTIVNLKILNFEAKNNSGQILINSQLQGPIRFEIEDDTISLNQPFLLKTNEEKKISLRIVIPDGAPLDDYYYTFLTESQPPPITEGVASLRAKITLTSNLLITVTKDGTVEVKPKISLFKLISPLQIGKTSIIDSFDDIPVVFIVENSGKNFIVAKGKFNLKGFIQNQDYQINQQDILGENQRLLKATFPNSYLLSSSYSLILAGFHLGKYELSVKTIFGDNSPTLSASTSFVAFPFKFFVGLTILFIIVLFTIKRLKDRRDD